MSLPNVLPLFPERRDHLLINRVVVGPLLGKIPGLVMLRGPKIVKVEVGCSGCVIAEKLNQVSRFGLREGSLSFVIVPEGRICLEVVLFLPIVKIPVQVHSVSVLPRAVCKSRRIHDGNDH
mgnify:CR=1 FL=1